MKKKKKIPTPISYHINIGIYIMNYYFPFPSALSSQPPSPSCILLWKFSLPFFFFLLSFLIHSCSLNHKPRLLSPSHLATPIPSSTLHKHQDQFLLFCPSVKLFEYES